MRSREETKYGSAQENHTYRAHQQANVNPRITVRASTNKAGKKSGKKVGTSAQDQSYQSDQMDQHQEGSLEQSTHTSSSMGQGFFAGSPVPTAENVQVVKDEDHKDEQTEIWETPLLCLIT